MQKFNQLVQHHDRLQPLLAQSEALARLQQLWMLAAPEWAQASTALACTHDTLVVGAHSGAVAHKIRLSETSLILRLQEILQNSKQIKGLYLNAIKVKVQVKSPAPLRQKRISPLSSQTLQHLQTFAANVDNPALQAALHHLIQQQKRR